MKKLKIILVLTFFLVLSLSAGVNYSSKVYDEGDVNGAGYDACVDKLTEGKGVYFVQGWSDEGFAVAFTVDSSGNSTFGNEVSFCSNVNDNNGFFFDSIAGCALDSSLIVVAYGDDGNSDAGYVRAATVSGTTISAFGTAVRFETGDVEYISICAINDTTFAILYNDESAGDYVAICICTVDGTTITAGTPLLLDGVHCINTSVTLLKEDVLITFYKETDGGELNSSYISISGTTPTNQNGVNILTSDSVSEPGEIKTIDESTVLYVWGDDNPQAMVGTISGTTITPQTQYELHATRDTNGENYNLALSIISTDNADTTWFAVTYADAGVSDNFMDICYIVNSTYAITTYESTIIDNDITSDEADASMIRHNVLCYYNDFAMGYNIVLSGTSLPSEGGSGWSGGDIMGVSDPGTINGVDPETIGKVNGIE